MTIFENKQKFDLCFIGAGISTAFTLLNFLEQLRHNPSPSKISIAIIEKHSEYFTGIPYGDRSGFSSLLITSLADFLPEPELGKFILWLNQHKDWLLEKFKSDGGTLSEKWFKHYATELEANNWKPIFIPRRFFGLYLKEKLQKLIAELESSEGLKITFITDEAEDIVVDPKAFTIIGKISTTLAKRVILAIGSPPPRTIWRQEELSDDKLQLFQDPYAPGIDRTLEEIDRFLKNTVKPVYALLVGANASALEMLYKLNDQPDRAESFKKFTFISTLGLVPDSDVQAEWKGKFIPTHLIALKESQTLTANQIVTAAFADLDEAESKNIGAATTVNIISSAFGALLGALNQKELENFACFGGNEIGRRQRCAGQQYANVVKDLKKRGRFEHIAGRFIGLDKQGNGEFKCRFLDTATQLESLQGNPTNLVINCVGSELLNSMQCTPLYKNLMRRKLCIPNKSERGFKVNDSFEATQNLHIIGPLLAGNLLDSKPVWHVEHCGRIIWLSALLANKLHDKLTMPSYSTS